jgi:hypothetical protein
MRLLLRFLRVVNADVVLITDFSGSMMKAVGAWNDQGFGVNNCEMVMASDRARKTHLARCLGELG